MDTSPHLRFLATAIGLTVAFSLVISLIFLSSVETVANEDHVMHVLTTAETTAPNQVPDPTPHPVVSLEFTSNGNGTCTLTGIGTATAASIVIPELSSTGERVISIAPQAFYGEQSISAIHIPASVVHIGALAFADCPSLSYISVSEKNEAYRSVDGVLYTADLSELILYPPRRAGESFTIHTATTVIREMAFFDCVYLKRIDYLGTPSQWERISIGSKNYTLLAIAKQFGA